MCDEASFMFCFFLPVTLLTAEKKHRKRHRCDAVIYGITWTYSTSGNPTKIHLNNFSPLYVETNPNVILDNLKLYDSPRKDRYFTWITSTCTVWSFHSWIFDKITQLHKLMWILFCCVLTIYKHPASKWMHFYITCLAISSKLKFKFFSVVG